MDRTRTLAAVGTALGSINLGIAAMFQEGLVSLLGASTGQVLTAWYLLAFLGVYQLYRVGSTASGRWSE